MENMRMVQAICLLTLAGCRGGGDSPESDAAPPDEACPGCRGTCIEDACYLIEDFALDQAGPTRIAADSSHLFWSNRGFVDSLQNVIGDAIVARPLDESSETTIVVSGHCAQSKLVVDASYLYWDEPGALWRAPKDGSSAAEELLPWDWGKFALAGDKLVLADIDADSLRVRTFDPQTAELAPVATIPDVNGVADLTIRGDTVFVLGGIASVSWKRNVFEIPLAGGESRVDFESDEYASKLRSNDTHLFLFQGGGENVIQSVNSSGESLFIFRESYGVLGSARIHESRLVFEYEQRLLAISNVPGTSETLLAGFDVEDFVIVDNEIFFAVPESGSGVPDGQILRLDMP